MLKGKKSKTALHFLALLKTQVASMTVGLEDNSEVMDGEPDGDEEYSYNEKSDGDESNNEEGVEDTEEESRETSNEEYLDFVYEADNRITKKGLRVFEK